jgi:GMP synthase (glutamine-hydrolysing)
MPSPRLLVVEGNSPQTMADHVAAGGIPASKGYSDLLRELLPGTVVDICYPGDPAALLPEGASLEGYDGIAITGSSLHVYKAGPEVMRQNPKGREIGFGRGIRLTEAGRKHPMYVGKLDVFNAPTVHLDEIEALAPGTTVLATNAVSDVQSAEIRTNGSIAWAVQYHPEYPLREIAAIVRRIGARLIEEGFFADVPDIETFAQDLDTLDRDPGCKRLAWRHGISKNVLDKKLRVGEVANWIEFQVLPMRVKRGRG